MFGIACLLWILRMRKNWHHYTIRIHHICPRLKYNKISRDFRSLRGCFKPRAGFYLRRCGHSYRCECSNLWRIMGLVRTAAMATCGCRQLTAGDVRTFKLMALWAFNFSGVCLRGKAGLNLSISKLLSLTVAEIRNLSLATCRRCLTWRKKKNTTVNVN